MRRKIRSASFLAAMLTGFCGLSVNAQIRDLTPGDTFSKPVGASSTVEEERVSTLSAATVMVKILGPGAQGSGVLARLPDGNLGVITARHVVSSLGNNESIDLIMTGGLRVSRRSKDIRSLNGLDIAVIALPSGLPIRRVASFSTKAPARGDEIFAAGFPITTESTNNTDDFRTYSGLIQTSSRTTGPSGFQLGYSSKTYIGMSGGAIFTSDGRLVAIHGRGEALSSSDVNKSGTNWGVPIAVVLKNYRANLTSSSAGKIEDTPRNLLSRDYKSALATWQSVSRKHPDSAIATHNVECLESIVQKRSYSPEKWKFDRRKSGQRLYDLDYALEVYWSDPLVRPVYNRVSSVYYSKGKEWKIDSYGSDIKRYIRWSDPYGDDREKQAWHPYPINAKTALVESLASRDGRFYKGCSVFIRAYSTSRGPTDQGYSWYENQLAPYMFDDDVLILGNRYEEEWEAARKKDRIPYHIRVLLPPE